jgi:hypothetical protein
MSMGDLSTFCSLPQSLSSGVCSSSCRDHSHPLLSVFDFFEAIVNSPKINEPIKKWASELNRTFSKEEIQMAKKHMKKCSPSLVIKEMQIKTTLRFQLTPVRIAVIKNTTNNRCWQGCGEKRTLVYAGGNAN